MPIDGPTRRTIRDLLRRVVRVKLTNYDPETDYKPFHHGLIGEDRYATFSFVHSMNTVLGMSVWKQVAVAIARAAGHDARMHHELRGRIDPATGQLIARIHDDLIRGRELPNSFEETEKIRASIRGAPPDSHPDGRVGLLIRKDDQEYYVLVGSAKPNRAEFTSFKLKLLRWKALRLSQERSAQLFATLAAPYNPYHPNPYDRWTEGGLFDERRGELLVGPVFWNFLAEDDIYDDLLQVFQDVGRALRAEIDRRFQTLG